MALTEKKIERTNRPGRYGDGGGLWLRVTATGRKSWVFRFEHAGRERWMGLGPLADVPLTEAREAARLARVGLRTGVDPIDARRASLAAKAAASAKAKSFKECAVGYFNDHKAKWSNRKSRTAFLATLEKFAIPVIGALPVEAIDKALVLQVLRPIWHAKPVTANRVRQRIEAVLDWATVNDFRSERPNPARWRGFLSKALPAREDISEVQNLPGLPYSELPTFMVALANREGVPAAALRFTILTGARSGETLGATWDEFDLAERLWVVPAARMKARREHRVPLSPAVIELLEALPREEGNDHTFIGSRSNGPLGHAAMLQLLRRMTRKRITVHAFRAAFRTWASERSSYPREIIEAALAHSLAGGPTEAAYLRSDALEKRRRLMDAWTTFATSPPKVGAVVPLRKVTG